jgi:hypothetical protein
MTALPALISTTTNTTTTLPQHPNTIQPPHTTHHQDQTRPINRDSKKPNLSLKQISNKTSIDPVVSWTSSLSRYCRNGQLHQAASHFTQMRLLEIDPNHVTFITLLSGCADLPSQGNSLGPLLHAYTRKLGLDTCNLMVGGVRWLFGAGDGVEEWWLFGVGDGEEEWWLLPWWI